VVEDSKCNCVVHVIFICGGVCCGPHYRDVNGTSTICMLIIFTTTNVH
jgi:hypothetical protein